MKLIYLMLAALVLSGCGPSQAERDAKEAKTKFREAVAAVKIICDDGGTYSEFRERELALLACLEANQPRLPACDFAPLKQSMADCDTIWNFTIKYPGLPLSDAPDDAFCAALRANPRLQTKRHLTYEQSQHDPDVNAQNYLRRAITSVAKLCADLMAR